MPYKLRITNEEVENELKKLGLTDLTEEMIEEFRKDLLKLIKNDLRMLKKMKKEKELKLQSEEERFKREIKFSTTSTPSSFLEQELEKEKVRRHKEKKDRRESESRSATTSEATSKQASSLSSESSSQDSEMEVIKREKDKKPVTTSVSVRKKEKPPILKEPKSELPPFPEKPDPVNLYHYYKAHWDKFKVPGEDPRNALRWAIRSKLFYSS